MKNFLYLCILIGFFSCKEKIDLKEVENQNLIKSKFGLNEIIRFSSDEQFEETLNNLKNSKKFEEEWSKNQKNFSSFENELKKELSENEKQQIIDNNGSNIYYFEKSENEIEALPQIKDKALQKIANKDGLILIGSEVVKFENDKKIVFKNFEPEMLLNYKKGYKSSNISIVNLKNAKLLGMNSTLPQNDSRHNYFRSDLRLKARYDYDGFTPLPQYWNNVTLTAELQDRFAGIWWNRTADSICMETNGFGGGTNCLSSSNSASSYISRASDTDLRFKRDYSYNFYVKAWCSENGGQYAGEVYVIR